MCTNRVPITGTERDNLSEEERCHIHCEHTLITLPPSLRPALHHSAPPPSTSHTLHHLLPKTPSPTIPFSPQVCVCDRLPAPTKHTFSHVLLPPTPSKEALIRQWPHTSSVLLQFCFFFDTQALTPALVELLPPTHTWKSLQLTTTQVDLWGGDVSVNSLKWLQWLHFPSNLQLHLGLSEWLGAV